MAANHQQDGDAAQTLDVGAKAIARFRERTVPLAVRPSPPTLAPTRAVVRDLPQAFGRGQIIRLWETSPNQLEAATHLCTFVAKGQYEFQSLPGRCPGEKR